MATFNSAMKCRLAAAIFVLAAGIIFADDAQTKIFAARTEVEFHRAESQYQADPTNDAGVLEFARACFDFADFATNNTERAELAKQGIAACGQWLARESNSAPAHYYLGMNLGQLARTEFLGALKLVKEMEREFETAANLDATFDFAGPERNLGLLYRDAPGWPASIGNQRKAAEFLKRAEKIAPDYPENILNLVESDLQWNQIAAAQKELAALDALWPAAQKKFAGERWERDWADWSARRDAARSKLEKLSPPAPAPKSGR